LRQIFATLIRGDKYSVVPLNNKTSNGYVLLHDVYGNAIGLLTVAIPRDMWSEAVKTIDFYISILIFGAIIILAMMWWLLQSQIVNRLLHVGKELITIAKSSKFSRRIQVSGADELADIPRSINVLLDVIQASQQELENRVHERTQELEQANVGLKKEIELREVVETKLRADEKLMEHMARHDALTGLPNRMLFNEFLLREIAKAKRYKTEFAILFLDLDRFKKINDALGHTAGDKYLQVVANELSNKLRSTDIVARLGGDEFLFYIGDFNQLFDLEKIAQKILEVIYTPRIILQQEVTLTGSIGIAVYPPDGLTFEELISNADVAMYRAKSSGGNQVFFFKEVMNLQAKSNLKLESELRQALKEEQLVVHFQPIISLHDKTLQGLEALVRWKHPTLGLLLPDKFISLAEKSNLIVALNEVVIRQAFAARKKWKEQGLNPGFLAINVSALQFRSRGFLANLSKLMEEFSIAGEDIIFEITESTLMESEELSKNILKALHGMAIKIAIDDFGTGYSSLSYLQKFAIHYLKIDQEFVKNIPHDKDSEAITNAVIVLGHSLHLKTIAEGVETKEQFDYLRAHSCDMVQGYLISRPASEENTTELLKSNEELIINN